MFKIEIPQKFINGSGDVLDLESKNLIHLKEFKNINRYKNPLFIEDKTKKLTVIDFEVKPGFFYVGDKEFHLFSEKVTDVIYNTTGKLKLKSFINGYSHIGLYGPFDLNEFGGKYRDTLIDKQEVYKSLYLNENFDFEYEMGLSYQYMYNPHEYPLIYKPESPLSICYTYWEKPDLWKPINPMLYGHDFETNTILLHPSLGEGFYIVEYENTTLKTLTGSNFNPLNRNVTEGFFMINTRLEDSKPDYVKIIDNFKVNQFNAVVSFEVYNFKGNILKNIDIDININTEFFDESGNKINQYIVDYNEYYTKYKILDRVVKPFNLVLPSGNLLKIAKDQDYFVLKTEGLIANTTNGDFSYYTKIKLNENGIGIIYFRLPLIKAKEQKVKIEFTYNGNLLTSLNLPNYNKVDTNNSIYIEDSFYDYIVEDVTEAFETSYIFIKELIPEELFIYTAKNFMEHCFGNGNLVEIIPTGVEISGNMLKYFFDKLNSENKQVIIKVADKKIDYIKLNGGYIY